VFNYDDLRFRELEPLDLVWLQMPLLWPRLTGKE
jgi:hypothetical protein